MNAVSITSIVFLETVGLSIVDDMRDSLVENMDHFGSDTVGDLGEFITLLAH